MVRKFTKFFCVLAFASFCISADTINAFIPTEAHFLQIQNRAIKIMPLGNSLTSALYQYCSYRCYLWNTLMDNGFRGKVDFVGRQYGVFEGGDPPSECDSFDLDHEGVPTVTSENILSTIHSVLNANIPDIVLMHIGTNDIVYSLSLSASKQNISSIIDSIRFRNPRVTILLSRIIPILSNNTGNAAFNNMLVDLAVTKNQELSPIIIIDNSIGYTSADYHSDLVHLSTPGEQKFASRWFEGLLPVLQNMTVAATPVEKVFEIFPTSGTLLSTQVNDVSLIVKRTNVSVTQWGCYLDGNFILLGGITGTLANGGISLRKRLVAIGSHLSIGKHTLIGLAKLNDSTILRDTVYWNVIQTNE